MKEFIQNTIDSVSIAYDSMDTADKIVFLIAMVLQILFVTAFVAMFFS